MPTRTRNSRASVPFRCQVCERCLFFIPSLAAVQFSVPYMSSASKGLPCQNNLDFKLQKLICLNASFIWRRYQIIAIIWEGMEALAARSLATFVATDFKVVSIIKIMLWLFALIVQIKKYSFHFTKLYWFFNYFGICIQYRHLLKKKVGVYWTSIRKVSLFPELVLRG